MRDQACSRGLIDEVARERGVDDLKAAAPPGGTFSHTFYQALATRS